MGEFKVDPAGRQMAWDLFVDLATGVIPATVGPWVHAGEPPTELYRLRDLLNLQAVTLGPSGAAVQTWVGQATRLLRDEGDRAQALQLLGLAARRLAKIARSPNVADTAAPSP